LALYTPAPLDPVAAALSLLAASLTAAVLELTRLPTLVGSTLVPLPVPVAVSSALLALLSNAVMVPVASAVSKVMLAVSDCVAVIAVTESAIAAVPAVVSCARAVAASAQAHSMDARMIAAVLLWISSFHGIVAGVRKLVACLVRE